MRGLLHNLKIIYVKSAKKYLPIISLYTILSGVGLALEICLPLKLGNIMDAAIGKGYNKVVSLLMQVLLLYLVLLVVSYFINKITIKISAKMSEEIKNKVMKEVMILPMKDIDLLENGQFISKLGDAEIIAGRTKWWGLWQE